MVGFTCVYIDKVVEFYGYFCSFFRLLFFGGGGVGFFFFFFFFFFLFNPSLLFSWMFEHDCLDTCCFGYLICMCCIFVFAPAQRNWACSTWKGALEIRSLS